MSNHQIIALDGSGTTAPLAVAGYESERESRNVVHDLLDGSVGIAYRRARGRSGTLTLAYDDRALAFASVALLSRPCPFLLASDVPEVGMRFGAAGRIEIAQDSEDTDLWYVDVDYQEVPA